MQRSRETESTTRSRISLGAEDILALLRASGEEIPRGATVTVQVPCGADWSGMKLDVGCDTDVVISWTVKTSS